MTKQSQINELKLALAKANASIDGLNLAARTAKERQRGLDECAAYAKKTAEETATLKHIRDGFVPIAELRRIVGSVNTRTIGDLTNRTVTLEAVSLGDRSPIGNAILDALLAKEPVEGYASGGYTCGNGPYFKAPRLSDADRALLAKLNEPSIKWTNEPPFFKVGDRVNVQTVPNNGGFLVSGPIV